MQLRTRDRLEALYNNDLIDLVQVDQFRQSVESQRSELLLRQNNLELALDRYKTGTLGLPADLVIELDQELIQPFQLIPKETTPLLESILELQQQLGDLPDEPELDALNTVLEESTALTSHAEWMFATAQSDLERLNAIVPRREQSMTAEEKAIFQGDRDRLYQKLHELKTGRRGVDASLSELQDLKSQLNNANRAATLIGIRAWTQGFQQVVERLSLVPAQARLELIMVEPINLSSEDAFQIALDHRLDFMNGRAALVDRWRAIQVNADALQSALAITADGDVRTARDNPLSFRAPTGNPPHGRRI